MHVLCLLVLPYVRPRHWSCGEYRGVDPWEQGLCARHGATRYPRPPSVSWSSPVRVSWVLDNKHNRTVLAQYHDWTALTKVRSGPLGDERP